jgi:ATP-dependent helicase HepA
MDLIRTNAMPVTRAGPALDREVLVIDLRTDLGVGRLKGAAGAVGYVEYFDHPGENGRHLHPVDLVDLRRGRLTPQTRIHAVLEEEWRHGRVIEHDLETKQVLARLEGRTEQVLDERVVNVRWRRPVSDATPFLAALAAESRRFYDGRSEFVHAYLDRATAYQRITALASASVELHPHQVEAARRVLEDVSQRYLLADEVGLGKTIEAGIVIRQHLLDRSAGKVVVVVPGALTSQWRLELANKFHIAEQFPDAVEIVSFDGFEQLNPDEVGLLIVDEAHRLAVEASASASGARRYECLAALAAAVPKVILLSATPLLQEPMSLLRLFHLLSPTSYRLDDLHGFEGRLENREELGTLYANLNAESQATFILAAIDGLSALLFDDDYALALLEEIRARLARGEADAVQRSVRRARAYIGEAYRMYGRMIRTRRGSGLAEEFPVLGRVAPTLIEVGRDSRVSVLLDAWRERLTAQAETEGAPLSPKQLAAARDVLQGAFGAGDALGDAARHCLTDTAQDPSDSEEAQLLHDLAVASSLRAAECPRLQHAVSLAEAAVREGQKVAIAVGTEGAASLLEEHLRAVGGRAPVIRISDADPEAAERFSDAEAGAILVFGPVGEEGQNLQAADLLIHTDLPWSPNRMEQRLGRFDRFGAGAPAQQVVLLEGDPSSLGDGWFACLRDGFGLFAGSIASLQLVVDGLMPQIVQEAVVNGAVGIEGCSDFVSGRLDDELQRIELAELLDETTAEEQGLRLIEDTENADRAEACELWAASVVAWSSGDGSDAADLRFHHVQERNLHQFALTRFDRPDVERLKASDLPLIPHDLIASRFAGAFDRNGICRGAFRRLTAAQRKTRLLAPGDPFVDALWTFTEEDDRGRAFAMWRPRTTWKGRPDTLAFCFDLRVYPNLGPAVETLPWESRESSQPAVRRRAEAYLPPLQARVWLNAEIEEVHDPAVVALLAAPYSEFRGDVTLRPWLWAHVDELVPRDAWPATCASARQRALEIVAARHELTERCAHAAQLMQADGEDAAARIQARGEQGASERAAAEADLVTALASGIASPRIDVDAAGIVILSSESLPSDELR